MAPSRGNKLTIVAISPTCSYYIMKYNIISKDVSLTLAIIFLMKGRCAKLSLSLFLNVAKPTQYAPL